MKKILFFILALGISAASNAQFEIKINASLLDKETQEPIPYVNISIENRSLEAVSDLDGKFTLVYDEEAILESDIVVFSHLSYKKLEVKVGLLYKLLTNSDKIFLTPQAFLNAADYSRQSSKGIISGTVFNETGTIQGATIRIKNTLNETQTNFDGYFTINASEDDILVVNYLGMLPKEVQAKQSKTVSIKLLPDGEILDAVSLQAKAKAQLVDTGYGKKSEDAVGYSVNTITEDDILPSALYLSDIIRGKYAGIQVSGFGNDATFIIRGINSINNPAPAIFDVEGIVYNEVPNFLNVQQIKSITILKSLAAANKYGTIGRGGVIQIKMKTVQLDPEGKPIDNALVKGNDYEENIKLLDENQRTSEITSKLEAAGSYEEALIIFEEQKRISNGIRIPFYLDASDYFMKWDADFSLKILQNISQAAYNNVKALKALAFKLEEKGHNKEALLVYQRIALLRPTDIQSYRDLALIYEASGNYSEAMKLYKMMLNNDIPDIDFSIIQNTIINEVKHLVAKHRQDLEYRDLHPDLLSIKFKTDIRIVFDWNDPNTEFEFQFVNPKKKFFNWAHTQFENKERMLDEIKNGYYTEEYVIDDAEPGEWIINIECMSDEDLINPTYLKYTVYKDYGLPSETKNVKVIKLYQQREKATLDAFIYK